MFIYADESGNSGRNIFDDQEYYHQGAILAVTDMEPAVEAVIRPILEAKGITRLHAHELPRREVAEIVTKLMDALDAETPWQFHLTTIHKPYLATTKFVDTVFDSGENVAVPPLWYNVEVFRHVLCCVIDNMLTPRNRERFWWAYLSNNIDGFKAAIRNAETYLDRATKDRRTRQIIRDAFRFALRHPDQFRLTTSKPRRAYQLDTPNMVAFSSLLQAIHHFVEEHGSVPVAFYHDSQQEFGTSMREMHDMFGPIRLKDHPRGGPPDFEFADYNLPQFSLPSSKDNVALQATDILLWVAGREKEDNLHEAKKRLADRLAPVYISRIASEIIVQGWMQRIYSADLTPTQLKAAKTETEKLERLRLERVAEFADMR